MDLIRKNFRILCLSPHPDDVEFGVGATLHKYGGMCSVKLIIFSDRSKTRGEIHNERDQGRALQRLGLSEQSAQFIDQLQLGVPRLPIRYFGTEENRDIIRLVISKVAKEFDPDLIFCPALKETMQDHQAISEEAVRVIRGHASILGYEVPKHNRFFQPNVFVNFSETNLSAKIEAINCYSEFSTNYYFEPEVIGSLARVRALHAGYFGLCEAFELYRLMDSGG